MVITSLVKLSLSSEAYQVLECTNGQEAIDFLQGDGNVDLIITDVNMPVMDGLTFIQQARKQHRYRSKPILVLSTESSDESRQRGKAAGATGWLVKPFTPDVLRSVVKLVTSR